MPRYIVKLTDEEGDWYFEYSTIVDAPVSYALRKDEFTEYYKKAYGEKSMLEFEQRMARVAEKGTSAMDYPNAEETVSFNHAGPRGEDLSPSEMLKDLKRQRSG